MSRKPKGETEVLIGKKRFFCDWISPPSHGYLMMGVGGEIHWLPTRNQRVRFVAGSILGAGEEEAAPARPPDESGFRGAEPGVGRVVDPAMLVPITGASDPDPQVRLAEAKKHERWIAMGMTGVKWGS